MVLKEVIHGLGGTAECLLCLGGHGKKKRKVYDREKNIYIYIFKRGFFFYFTVRVLEMQNNKERNVVYRYSLFRFKK